MRRQKCSQCGTMLDVSKLEKGAKFACANCGTILVVGEAAVTKRSLKDSGPAFERKSKKAKKAAPEVAKPARRSRARAESDAAPAKSKLPLFLIIGVLVIGGGAAAFLMGGDGGGGGGAGGGQTAVAWWQEKEAQLADADAKTLRAWIAEAKAKGYDKDSAFWGPRSDQIYKALLKKAPADKEANRAAGRRSLRDYPDFQKVWNDMSENFEALSKEEQAFLERWAGKVDAPGKRPVFVNASQWTAAKAVLDGYVEAKKTRKKNPAAAKVAKAMRDASQILGKVGGKDYGFVTAVEGPFILLLAYLNDGSETTVKPELEKRAKQYALALATFKKRFDQSFRDPLGLNPIEDGRYFVHLVLARQEDLRRFMATGEGLDSSGDIPGYWSARTRWSHVWVDPAQPQHAAGDLAHEATHQFHWYFSRDKKMKALYHMDRWNGLWFTEGWAEYAGGLSFDPATGQTKYTGKPARRIAHLQKMRDNGMPLFTLRDLVQFDNMDTFRRSAADAYNAAMTGPLNEGARAVIAEGAFHIKTFYAQAWLLAHFMNHHGQGAYKQKYLDIVRSALTGRLKPDKYKEEKMVAERFDSAYDAFVEIMGIKSDADWQRLNTEYQRHLPVALRN